MAKTMNRAVNKYDLNEFSPEELRNIYIDMYTETFECSKDHAVEVFLAEYGPDRCFHNYKNVEDAIENMARFCGM